MRFSSIGILFMSLALLGCQVETKGESGGQTMTGAAEAPKDVSPDGEESTTSSFPGEASAPSVPSNGSGNPNKLPQGLQLTAGEFNDALNPDTFLKFIEQDQQRLNFPGDATSWLAMAPLPPTAGTNKIEIALVLDVTGSMGDELRYLQAEWDALIGDLAVVYPGLNVKLSLVAYRDQGDSFVTAAYAFTEDRMAFQTELKKYSAGGGGDWPEAADQALLNAQDFAWGDAASAKLLFWLADAPPHEEKESATYDAIMGLRNKGVTIYPIAASGVEARAEKIMRISAVVTGGSYLFLTDDSGIGNKHAEPHIPCYNVELLNKLLQRVIAERITGQKITPQPESIIRKVGNMQSGVCQP